VPKTPTFVFLGAPYVPDDQGILRVCDLMQTKGCCRRFSTSLTFPGS
jgi:hypothetical protein